MDINMKSLLIEVTPITVSPQALNESRDKVSGNPLVETILTTVEEKNGNGRYYSKELWEREINKYAILVKERRALGELDHPDSQIINLKNVSHNITKVWWNENKIMGILEILPTPSGNIVKSLIESGIKVGVSSRGMGSLKQVGEVLEVQDDFDLLGWDVVSTPSNPNSWISPLNESKITTLNPYNKVDSIVTEILCSNGSCPIF
jgi:hypothetical protein